MTIIIIKIIIIVMVIMIIKIQVRHLELTYQVLSSLIFETPGTQSLHFKCPALATLIFEVPGIQNLHVGWPALAALIFEVPGNQNLNFKCPAAGIKLIFILCSPNFIQYIVIERYCSSLAFQLLAIAPQQLLYREEICYKAVNLYNTVM